jgi:hypothetical protein
LQDVLGRGDLASGVQTPRREKQRGCPREESTCHARLGKTRGLQMIHTSLHQARLFAGPEIAPPSEAHPGLAARAIACAAFPSRAETLPAAASINGLAIMALQGGARQLGA